MRFVPVGREEYDHVSAQVESGAYEHQVAAYAKFSIRAYHAWLETLDMSVRF